ncbi:MAG: bifunctional acetate--CoA ligase family protein/GNAT family N-acetyltransferase [Deltaproteobacteria bacterium]|nr:bifunctional acetate--CoA ligase family protein/GNAT family N-acetyltransferase [Deltaproteobacteria bacterium]
MGLFNLDKIFKPESVAVIGASPSQGSIGFALMENLTGGGYEGRIVPVNPKHSEIMGIKTYPALSMAKQDVDLAIIATPIATVPEIVKECVETGVGGAIIISAGGRETGPEGLELEKEIDREARKGGLRIIGPNCMGIIRPDRNLNASFAAHMVPKGNLAFISQSGAICSAMLDLSLKEHMGFRYFVSIGAMLDVDFGDLIDYLGMDPEVKSILLYIESLTHFRKFMSAARAVSRVKPIVILKAGKGKAGARAAASHTGAMAGEDTVYEAAFKRAGAVRVDTLQDFFDCAELLAKQPLPSGRRLVVITNSGGPGVMAADAIEEYGLELSPLSRETMNGLNKILPPHWSHGNPIDILGDATAERYEKAAECCFKAGEIDGMLVIVNPQAMTNPTEVARTLGKGLQKRSFQVFTALMGGADVEEGRHVLNRAGIPTYDTPERAIRSFMFLDKYARNLKLLQEIPSKLLRDVAADEDSAREVIGKALEKGECLLTETESKRLLSSYGIPVNRTETAGSPEAAVGLASEIGYPVVMKVLSPDISHKTEAGGVLTDLGSDQEVREAYEKIMNSAHAYDPEAEILGVTLQSMIKNPDVELLVGAVKDPNFGPVIVFGLGGIFAEVLGDREMGLPPLNRTLARRLMEPTKAFTLLNGFRNIPPADMSLLEKLIVCLSHLLVDFPEIAELDMNPVIVKDGKPYAVDARVLIKKSDTPSPLHLVISPYPEQYEFQEVTSGGVEIFIRPIRPEDASLLLDLFDNMSMKSRYQRFFIPMKSLSNDLLIQLTQIDYDRHIALVALRREAGEDEMLGVARAIAGPDNEEAEFSVAVGDAWQGKGIGRKLLRTCLRVGKEYGIKTLYGTVLAENTQMLGLAREFGFKVTRGKGGNEYQLFIDLEQYQESATE